MVIIYDGIIVDRDLLDEKTEVLNDAFQTVSTRSEVGRDSKPPSFRLVSGFDDTGTPFHVVVENAANMDEIENFLNDFYAAPDKDSVQIPQSVLAFSIIYNINDPKVNPHGLLRLSTYKKDEFNISMKSVYGYVTSEVDFTSSN